MSFRSVFTNGPLNENVFKKVAMNIMKNSTILSGLFLKANKLYGLRLPTKVTVDKVFTDTLASGYKTAIIRAALSGNSKDQTQSQVLGIFDADEDIKTGKRFSYKRVPELEKQDIQVYYFRTPNKRG